MKFHLKDFREERVEIDGNTYERCTFTKCDMVFSGKSIPTLVDNAFSECNWKFEGAAEATIIFMRQLYHGGGKDLIEVTFQNIRRPLDAQ